MIFIKNKYTSIYYKIIDASLHRGLINKPYEKHHIIPESFFKNRKRSGELGLLDGNPNDPSNLVFLTPREHAFCHKLLVRMTFGKMKSKMELAIWRMMNSKNKKLFSSKEYKYYRVLFIKHITEVNKNLKRKPLSDAHKQSISTSTKKVTKSNIAKANMKAAWVSRDRTVKNSTRELNKIASIAFWSSSEAKEAQSIKRKEYLHKNPAMLSQQVSNINQKIKCEHCSIVTNLGNYKRWHGKNCRLNNI